MEIVLLRTFDTSVRCELNYNRNLYFGADLNWGKNATVKISFTKEAKWEKSVRGKTRTLIKILSN